MAVKGLFLNHPVAEVTTIRDAMSAGIIASMARGTSYTIAGRSFTFPGITEASNMLAEANAELSRVNGTRSQVVRANFNDGMGRYS